ncbi:Listeria/Bacterioides repeat-containing protein [Sporobacter termitidis DSM 10068]|uniref:Lysozyme n=1 Tax=Sporobacter termitidis DSM 10068 TaxID=1123282 RepID=A0A1M5ZFM1_9FIRM|nr:GH25 family lysozyme [Sporobacter termitidis]SHI23065.1 Listeria/Bacterioides repeat-containing protein [Sporobacter termitidis DSM 10068]
MIKKIICIVLMFCLAGSVATVASAAGLTGSGTMTVSQSGIKFIEGFENSSGNGATGAEAENQLAAALQPSTASVNKFIASNNISLTQAQFDALVSFTYNLGSGWTDPSNRISSYLTGGLSKYSEIDIVNAIGIWCHVGKAVNTQLIVRRLAEANLFISGDYNTGDRKYTYVIFDAGKGSMEHDIYFFKYGQPYGTLPGAKLSGYTFAGWYTSNGAVVNAGDIAGDNLTVTAKWTGGAIPQAPANNFPDISANDWFYTYVSDLNKRNVVNGFPDGTFRPASTVSCAEALKLIILAAGYSEQPSTSSSWAGGYLKFAVSKGLIDAAEIPDINGTISRQLIAKIASRALGLAPATVSSPFADTADQYVLSLYSYGVVEGSVSNGSLLFMPDSSITRAEISAIVWRINNLNLEPDPPPATTDPIQNPGTNPGAGDHTNQIQFGSTWLDVLQGVPVNSYDKSAFYLDNGLLRYNSQTVKTKIGVDVSSYQDTIDWQKVKNAGIDFAILRVGFRGYGSSGSMNLDSRFRTNLTGALNAGLKVGVYFFSQAITPQEAIEEADFVLSEISGYDIAYPIVFDWETVGSSSARTAGMSTQMLTQCARAFCGRVAAAGYTPMIYFNMSLGYLKYDLSAVQDYKFWLAQYTATPTFYYDFQMWQYTSSGTVDGIPGNVDMDISFER